MGFHGISWDFFMGFHGISGEYEWNFMRLNFMGYEWYLMDIMI